jgi:hypothetical protein
MPAPDKPRHRSGYTTEETEQVRAVCLTVAVTLGAYLGDVCIVGGLVPPLLIDGARTDEDDLHPGTNDLDIGLALALLDDERYARSAADFGVRASSPIPTTAATQPSSAGDSVS